MLYSVVIPMYNESQIIGATVRELVSRLDEFALSEGVGYELIFSDDGSIDSSADIVNKTASEYPARHGTVRIVSAERNCGKGHAVRTGILASRGDYVLFTDSDLAYGSEKITEMLKKISLSGDDLLIGSRAIDKDGYAGYSFVRKLASKTFLTLLSLCAGFSHTDSQCGIKAFCRKSADAVFTKCTVDGWAFDFEALLIAEKLGFTVAEHPVKIVNHRASKINVIKDSIKMMREVMRIKKRVKHLDYGA